MLINTNIKSERQIEDNICNTSCDNCKKPIVVKCEHYSLGCFKCIKYCENCEKND